MSNLLYDRSTGEIRARVFDDLNNAITNATLLCSLYDANLRPAQVFVDRVMSYASGHPYADPLDLGCYFCTVLASELTGPDGLWQAVITATDTFNNVLTMTAYIEVSPFVATG